MPGELEFLTNEVVEGELLAVRLAAGPLLPAETLQFAIDIGRALAAAHTEGVVHGCLSPERVMLTARGARLLQPLGSRPARYRSPEQVRGEAADWRGDIFAFGALVYEMAAGKPAFAGEGAELDDAILNEPAPPLTPKSPVQAGMEAVIAGCLEKDKARRRQRIRNAVIELKLARRALPATANHRAATRSPAGPGSAPAVTPASQTPPLSFPLPGSTAGTARPESPVPGSRFFSGVRFRRRLGIVGLGTLVVAATAVSAVLFLHQRPLAPVVKFSVHTPEHTSYPATPAVSPDGRHLAFSAVSPEGRRMLWLRALDETGSQVIPGTEGGFAPFWSPDSEYVAFFADQSLKKVRIRNVTSETRPQTLCAVEAQPGGGAWNKDGVILFAPGMSDGLYRIPEAGGTATLVLRPNASKQERGFLWPQFLPDGRHFLFFNETAMIGTTGVYAGAIDAAEYRRLFASETNAVYSAVAGAEPSDAGFLLYMKDRDLRVQGFNASKLAVEGAPTTLANDIGALRTLALAPISASANAVLVYESVGQPLRQLVWMDRTGKQTGTVGEGGAWGPPRLSPDGTRAAVGKLGTDGANADLWIFDSGGNGSQFVYQKGVSEGFPVWSPEGSRIAFWSNPEGVYDLYVKSIAGVKIYPIYKNPFEKLPADWSRDGRYLFFALVTPATKSDVWSISLSDRRVGAVIDSIHNEGYPALSPDGRWLAYQADDTGDFEVYVQAFNGISSGPKRRWKLSARDDGQAGLPRWRADGKELFYITGNGSMMSVSVAVNDGELIADAPKRLFGTRPIPKTWNLFDVSPDGQRFLLNIPLEWSSSSVITVMTNWTEKLKK